MPHDPVADLLKEEIRGEIRGFLQEAEAGHFSSTVGNVRTARLAPGSIPDAVIADMILIEVDGENLRCFSVVVQEKQLG